MSSNILWFLSTALLVNSAVLYLACLQCSDPLPEAVGHSFRDHGIQQRITSLLLFVKLLDDFLQLSVFLLLLEDQKWGTRVYSYSLTSLKAQKSLFAFSNPLNPHLSCMTGVDLMGEINRGAELSPGLTWSGCFIERTGSSAYHTI